jgi:hypothetical protein
MNDRLEEVLTARLGELGTAAGMPDWTDVQRRARRRRARRRAMRGLPAAAVGLVAILAATPAFGLRGQIVQLFSGDEPAPPEVVESFAQMDVAAPPGMAPGVIAGEAREVMRVQLSTGKTWVMWVAPTRSGGFCMPSGCDRDRVGRFAPGLSIPGPISREGEILAPPVIFEGDTLIHGATTVEIRYQDGESARTSVVWVSPPIDAGFFVYEVPEAHWAAGHRPTALVLEDADGNELARNTQIAHSLVDLPHGH